LLWLCEGEIVPCLSGSSTGVLRPWKQPKLKCGDRWPDQPTYMYPAASREFTPAECHTKPW
jgi:hypothetical protein